MANPDLSDAAVRRKIIEEINSSENKSRKLAEQRKFDIYRKRQAEYVLERLQDEFNADTVRNMRKVLSINPCKRIVDEQASLYVEEPVRHWTNTENDLEKEMLEEIYSCGNVNPQMRLANRYFKLHGQSCLYIIPKDGKLMTRALTVKDYDVIPDEDDPEKAYAYILNVMDLSRTKTTPSMAQDTPSQAAYTQTDGRNEQIADANDGKGVSNRYIFWTEEMHFTCDSQGLITSEAFAGDGANAAGPIQPNPIGRLPFVDIANEKDFQFFVRIGSDVAEFVIDFLTQLSDLANTCRLQNYSQAIVYSTEEPKSLNLGPNKVIWLKMDPNMPEAKPQFVFESPSPDIAGTLEFLNVQLKMFLSSVGLNPGTVSGKNEMEKFTSGIDHLLSNLDKFKASKEDMDVFRKAEYEVFDVIKAWHGVMKDVTDEKKLNDDLITASISEKTELDMSYHEPQAVMTASETEDYCIKAVDKNLMTRKEAVKRMYKVDDDRADEIIIELDAEAEVKMQKAQDAMAQGLGPDGKPLPPVLPGATGKPGLPPGPGKPKPGEKVPPDDKAPPADLKKKKPVK